jgi:hypothetical protein
MNAEEAVGRGEQPGPERIRDETDDQAGEHQPPQRRLVDPTDRVEVVGRHSTPPVRRRQLLLARAGRPVAGLEPFQPGAEVLLAQPLPRGLERLLVQGQAHQQVHDGDEHDAAEHKKGASTESSFAFSFASTNLVFELGILIYVLLGPAFLAAERNVPAELTAPATDALPVVSRSRPPRMPAIRSWFTRVSISAVMNTPSRNGHRAL